MGKPGLKAVSGIPLTHFDRVKNALRSTLTKLHSEVEATRKAGKITADYSLGFVNALIWIEHQIHKRPGQPMFYNRTTSVGSLPKPTALNCGDATKDTTTYQVLMDDVLLKTRGFLEAGNSQQPQDTVFQKMAEMEKAIQDLDTFTAGDKDGRHESGTQPSTDAQPQPTV